MATCRIGAQGGPSPGSLSSWEAPLPRLPLVAVPRQAGSAGGAPPAAGAGGGGPAASSSSGAGSSAAPPAQPGGEAAAETQSGPRVQELASGWKVLTYERLTGKGQYKWWVDPAGKRFRTLKAAVEHGFSPRAE
jgi:hypothetical protein